MKVAKKECIKCKNIVVFFGGHKKVKCSKCKCHNYLNNNELLKTNIKDR